MTSRPFMPFYVGDHVAATGHLTAEEHGAHCSLLFAMWRTSDGTLPNNPRKLARVAGVHAPRWARVWDSIGGAFEITEEGRITSPRLQKELRAYEAKRLKRQIAGRLGGQTRAYHGAQKRGSRNPTLVEAKTSPNPLISLGAGQANAQAKLNHSESESYKEKKGSPPDLSGGSVGSPKKHPNNRTGPSIRQSSVLNRHGTEGSRIDKFPKHRPLQVCSEPHNTASYAGSWR